MPLAGVRPAMLARCRTGWPAIGSATGSNDKNCKPSGSRSATAASFCGLLGPGDDDDPGAAVANLLGDLRAGQRVVHRDVHAAGQMDRQIADDPLVAVFAEPAAADRRARRPTACRRAAICRTSARISFQVSQTYCAGAFDAQCRRGRPARSARSKRSEIERVPRTRPAASRS